MEKHAERPTYLSEHLLHTVDDFMVLGWHVGLAGDGSNPWHNFSFIFGE
jgi:hypothetical protein